MDKELGKFTVAAENISLYQAKIRSAGFHSCLINEDLIDRYCSRDEILVHLKYSREIAKEVLAGATVAQVLFDDSFVCRSDWLNERKQERLRNFGPADALASDPLTLHLLELSPCLRWLIESARQLRKETKIAVAEFGRRRFEELSFHQAQIDRMSNFSGCEAEVDLQRIFSEHLSEVLCMRGFETKNYVNRSGVDVSALSCFIDEKNVLLVVPNVIKRSSPHALMEPSGTLSCAFRLVSRKDAEGPLISVSGKVFGLSILLPNRFNDYGLFEGCGEFLLNVLAWRTALETVLPDVVVLSKHPDP